MEGSYPKIFTDLPAGILLDAWQWLARSGGKGSFLRELDRKRFSRRWFDAQEKAARETLNAAGIPRSQLKIAQAVIERCQLGRKARGALAQRYGWEILHLSAAFDSEPDRLRGAKIAASARQGGKRKGRERESEREKWQRRAEEVWAKLPNHSARSVARHIDRGREETIRRVIKKPRGKNEVTERS